LKDGTGTLSDGTEYVCQSGEDFGENGYRKRWKLMQGRNRDFSVRWEEYTYEATDWSGLRQRGSRKSGCNRVGDEWYEIWSETFTQDAHSREPQIERSAHKWARTELGGTQDWEEKWGEVYKATGEVHKWADKRATGDGRQWFEKWGEDYAGRGSDYCVKWTDKWTEVPSYGSAHGDKWREEFEGGKGRKDGETWSWGFGWEHRKYWGEIHRGDGSVQKFGHSTDGHHYDVVEHQDTYYESRPHFTYHEAVKHSPNLMTLPVLSRDVLSGDNGVLGAADQGFGAFDDL
jgi:hypothetical protein